MSPNTLLQVSYPERFREAVAEAIDYLPTLVAALVILLVGYVVGRLLGGLVTRILRRIGLSRYARGTAVEEVDGEDGLARALGTIVAYYVYFVAILAAADVLDIPQLTTLLADLGGYIPVVLGAIVVLVLGFVAGRILGDIVAGVVGDLGIGPYLAGTPLERFGDTAGEFGRLVGALVTYYVYLLTLLAVADILAIPALSTLLNDFAAYVPVLAGGLLLLLVGIWVAERVADLVAESDDSRGAHLLALAVKVFVYYVTVTVVLSTIGFEIAPLTNLFNAVVVAFLGALALALAIGIGVAVGWGGHEYVAENVDDWASSLRDVATEEGDEDEGSAATE